MADGDIVETWVVPVSFLVVGAKVVDEKVRPVGVIPGVLDVCSSELDVCPEVVEVCLSEVDICLEYVDEGAEVIGSVVPVAGVEEMLRTSSSPSMVIGFFSFFWIRCGMLCFPLMPSNSCTFFRMRLITPILVRTCCRLSPSLGTPSANVSLFSLPGSQRWRMKRLV